MDIFITGGTGFVGSALSKMLLEKGHSVKILTRKIRTDKGSSFSPQLVEGDSTQSGQWMDQLAGSDVVINLAGASIFKRWTPRYKQELIQSRIRTTGNLVNALAGRKKDNVIFISTSAVGYYGFHGDEELDEDTPNGPDFLASLSRSWEEAANKALMPGIRVVINRFGVVLGKDGGAIPMMTPLFKYRIGSRLGNGRQYFSWIHIKDLVNIIMFQIENRELEGAFNCTAPNPVTNRELTNTIASVMKKPLFMPPVPGFVIKLVMGEFANVLLKGQRVIPRKLMDAGYSFEFPEIKSALEDILW